MFKLKQSTVDTLKNISISDTFLINDKEQFIKIIDELQDTLLDNQTTNIYEIEKLLLKFDNDHVINYMKHICRNEGSNSVTSDIRGILLSVNLVTMSDEDEDDGVIVPGDKYESYFDLSDNNDIDSILLNR